MHPFLILLLGIGVVLFCIIVLRLHAVLALLFAALAVGLLTSPSALMEYGLNKGMSIAEAEAFSNQLLGKRLAAAFGNTCAKIGILIAMASIIGTCLMKSGAAERIVRSLLRLFGQKNASFAFLSGSFTLGIPVFFDTVFYLLIPIVKSVAVRNPKKYSLYLMAVIAGGVMAHSLVPPTPGPLFVAEEMGVDLGIMIIGGLVVGMITVLAGYIYASWANPRWELPLRDTPDMSIAELKNFSGKPDEQLPKPFLSFLPILLPLVLIAGNTILSSTMGTHASENLEAWQQLLLEIMSVLGESNIALILSAAISMYILWIHIDQRSQFQVYLEEALSSAGVIILITATGGALGGMLQQTGIAFSVEKLASQYHLALLPLSFFITAIVRTAQGSATVAMITAIGVLGGLANMETLGFHPVYMALAIGCGSKLFPWMNDSGFWVVTKMSGMTEGEGIRFFSFLLSIMGLTGLVTVMVLAKLFPFI